MLFYLKFLVSNNLDLDSMNTDPQQSFVQDKRYLL
jgi:hypothetical protein